MYLEDIFNISVFWEHYSEIGLEFFYLTTLKLSMTGNNIHNS